MIDLSDGLAGDAAHLSAASGVAILLSRELIPIHPAVLRHAATRDDALRLALAGGEDYELCFTAAPGAVEPHVRAFQAAFGIRLTCVGRASGGDGVWWTDAEGHRQPLGMGGYQHFGGAEGGGGSEGGEGSETPGETLRGRGGHSAGTSQGE